ncbi:MAG: MATE family efflux transporter [Puniceicoccales bacterium]|jgi:MATE family multidrug resistance protein|nr:MATE family efflux transporter [Puniceicoccales bacterium]
MMPSGTEHNHIDCSLKNVLGLTMPMVLTAMSHNLMYLIDRFMVARYSIDAMNAVAMASSFLLIFVLFLIGVASSAEVFVGQYNGTQQYEKLAVPTWQMIYTSLAASLFFIPLAYGSDYINTFPSYYLKDGVDYQKIMLYFAALPAIKAAFAAFFVGQGKGKIIAIAVAVGMILNIILDYLLIYGMEGILPALGAKGAAIATVLAEFCQILILAALFFSKNNRKTYKTFTNRAFDRELTKGCWKVGFPISLGNFACLLAWYLVQIFISHSSKDATTVYNIGLNLYVFCVCVGDGINKSVAAITANMIGRGDLESIEKIRKIFVIVSICFGGIIVIPLGLCPEWIFGLLTLSPDLYAEVKIVCYWVALDVVLEALLLSTWGILLAGGDSKYAMFVHQISLWLLVVLPVGVLYYIHALRSVPIIFVLTALWLIVVQFFVYGRYKSLKWYRKLV